MSEELKPCPFCGGECDVGTVRYSANMVKDQGWDQSTFYKVNCIICGANNLGLVGHKTPDAAVAHWNRRTPDAFKQGLLRAAEICQETEDAIGEFGPAMAEDYIKAIRAEAEKS